MAPQYSSLGDKDSQMGKAEPQSLTQIGQEGQSCDGCEVMPILVDQIPKCLHKRNDPGNVAEMLKTPDKKYPVQNDIGKGVLLRPYKSRGLGWKPGIAIDQIMYSKVVACTFDDGSKAHVPYTC
jgi:hypothetical protein